MKMMKKKTPFALDMVRVSGNGSNSTARDDNEPTWNRDIPMKIVCLGKKGFRRIPGVVCGYFTFEN